MKTITVKGIGSASAKADLVVITLRLSSIDKNYETSMEIASAKIKALTETLTDIRFTKEDLKTTHFDVRTQYRSVKDRNGNYKEEFEGYVVDQDLKLEFTFDNDRLAETLSAIASGISDPSLNIHFTVKDPSAINEEVLISATKNARKKAEIITLASGKKLGEIVTIDYNWSEVDIYSKTRFNINSTCMTVGSAHFDMEPEDISVSDTITFVYELLD